MELGLHGAGSTTLPLPQPELLPPVQHLVPIPIVAPALSTQFDDLATLIVTRRLPTALATAPVMAPVQLAPVPADLEPVISSRLADIFPGPVPAPEYKSEIAARRQTGQPTDGDIVVAEQLQGPAVSVAAPLPYTRFRLRDKLQYWKQIGAPKWFWVW